MRPWTVQARRQASYAPTSAYEGVPADDLRLPRVDQHRQRFHPSLIAGRTADRTGAVAAVPVVGTLDARPITLPAAVAAFVLTHNCSPYVKLRSFHYAPDSNKSQYFRFLFRGGLWIKKHHCLILEGQTKSPRVQTGAISLL